MIVKIIYILGSYLLGSVLGGQMVAKLLKVEDFAKQDLPGGAGTYRQLGLGAGVAVAGFDIDRRKSSSIPLELRIVSSHPPQTANGSGGSR